MCTVVLKESNTSLTKLDKMNKSEPKQAKLAKQNHGVNTIHTNICVAFDMTYHTTVRQLFSTFLKKKLSIEHRVKCLQQQCETK